MAFATLAGCGDRSSSAEFLGNDESTSLTKPPWPLMTTLPARLEQFGSQDGTVILIALDVEDLGVYQPHLPQSSTTTLCNGSTPAVAGYAPVEAIQPCGVSPGFREVLLRLSNGRVLASLSNNAQGGMTRLAFLPDGTYMTTDSMNCRFLLSTDGQMRSVS